MRYRIQFHSRYLETVLEVWEAEFGFPGMVATKGQSNTIAEWYFGEDMKLYEDTLSWLDHLQSTGFVRHVRRIEKEGN